MPTTTAPAAKLGDRVVIDPEVADKHAGVIWTVTAVKRVNATITPEGGGRSMRINPAYLRPAGSVTDDDARPAFAPIPVLPPLGTVVQFKRAFRDVKTTDLFVVIRTNAESMSVARLGGDNDRYLRGVRPASVTLVDASRISLR